MSITRTEAELRSAIETMFRVRAVESPPDDSGARTIWHRGSKGADLVTWVDAFGRVTRQELYLFEDCLVWEKAAGVRTGQAEAREGSPLSPAPGMIAFDHQADDHRLGRARKALVAYLGADKFILHARGLVAGDVEEEEEVTRSSGEINKMMLEAAVRAAASKAELKSANRKKWIAIGIASAALLGAAGIWLVTHAL